MRDRIYIYRALRNALILNILFPVFEIFFELFVNKAVTLSWLAEQYPWLILPPVLLGFLIPFLIPYKILELNYDSSDNILRDIEDAMKELNYTYKKLKAGMIIYRFRAGYAKFFYLYFDRIYIEKGPVSVKISSLPATIERIEEILAKNKSVFIR